MACHWHPFTFDRGSVMKVSDMTPYGVWDTDAHWGMHLHPLESTVFWFPMNEMRLQIKRNNYRPMTGKSNNKEDTGYGLLVPKREGGFINCIRSTKIPDRLIKDVDWTDEDQTQRQMAWYKGRPIGLKILREGLLFKHCNPENWKDVEGWEKKYNGVTFTAINDKTRKAEFVLFKIELVISEFLFIQEKEGNYNPHITKRGKYKHEKMPGGDTWQSIAKKR